MNVNVNAARRVESRRAWIGFGGGLMAFLGRGALKHGPGFLDNRKQAV
jgi:hypothetical protein